MTLRRPLSIRNPRRHTRLRATRLRVESLEDRSVPSIVPVTEAEPPGTLGLNNTLATAEFLPGFGTGAGEYSGADISGFTTSPTRTVASAEDDGSIPLANPTGLVTSGTDAVVVTAHIGDGPHGSVGTGAGDYDHYRFAARADQLLTADTVAALIGSSLDTVIGLYDSSGTLLASNDDAFDNASGHTTDSLLFFLIPADDNYSLVVFDKGSGFQADPFDPASGGGAASEGDYQLTIALESPVRISQTEDDGALSLANETGLTAGAEGLVIAAAFIGDGPDGSGGTGLGDFDLYRLEAAAGQIISVGTDTPDPLNDLDTMVETYDSSGHLLAFNNDFLNSDGFIRFEASATGAYFALVAGVASEGDYSVTIGVSNNEIDYYSFDLQAGDILGALLVDGADHVELYGPDGTLLVGSFFDDNVFLPESSPLPGGGFSSVSYVINTPGRYTVGVSYGNADYNLQLRAFRPALEEQPVFNHQVLFLDFDGATLTPDDFPVHPDRQDLNNEVNPNATLSPLSSFLGAFGLTAADESAVIDAIVATVAENYAQDVSGVLGVGKNGDFQITGQAGEFQIEILNSRDHADPFGLYPNVSRVIIGGTVEEFGPFVLGMSPTIDVGNFDTSETAVALLDLLSDPDFPRSLHQVPRADGASMIDLIGVAMGNLVSHEAGHFFGNWHTDPFLPPFGIMTQFGALFDLGPDGTFGTADDGDVDFGQGIYSRLEDFAGVEDTLNTIAFGLSTGTNAGTYYDFVDGTLYVSGTIDDSQEDRLEARTRGSNLEVFINGNLADTRPLATVQRIFFNGSSDDDKMDAAGLDLPVTMMGRGGDDKLTGGHGDDYLDGGTGADRLAGGHGNDILLGGEGNDKLECGQGSDLLIGGRGGDKLEGGGGDDLFIAGFTAFDANQAALAAILSEWTSPRDYETRVANLRGDGTGPRLNGDYFLKTNGPDATLYDDSDEDRMTGDSGRDWFIANLTGDGIKDKITDLPSGEFTDDLG